MAVLSPYCPTYTELQFHRLNFTWFFSGRSSLGRSSLKSCKLLSTDRFRSIKEADLVKFYFAKFDKFLVISESIRISMKVERAL